MPEDRRKPEKTSKKEETDPGGEHQNPVEKKREHSVRIWLPPFEGEAIKRDIEKIQEKYRDADITMFRHYSEGIEEVQRMHVAARCRDEATLDKVIWEVEDLAETAIELAWGREGYDDEWMQWALGEIDVRKYSTQLEEKQENEGEEKGNKENEGGVEKGRGREEGEKGEKHEEDKGEEKGKGAGEEKTQEDSEREGSRTGTARGQWKEQKTEVANKEVKGITLIKIPGEERLKTYEGKEGKQTISHLKEWLEREHGYQEGYYYLTANAREIEETPQQQTPPPPQQQQQHQQQQPERAGAESAELRRRQQLQQNQQLLWQDLQDDLQQQQHGQLQQQQQQQQHQQQLQQLNTTLAIWQEFQSKH